MTIEISDPAELGFDAERLKRIDSLLKERYLDSGRLPHTAVLIGRGDEVAHLSLQGNARDGQPLKEDAIFRIASMTKPITSIAFMMLLEEAKVALSTHVSAVIPEWKDLGVFVAGGGDQPFMTRPVTKQMQMIDLLRHTSGLTYGFQERSPVDAAYRKMGTERFDSGTLDDFAANLAKIPLEFDPGSSWNYSVSTDALGLVVQRLSGMPLEDFLRTRIFEPLGMVDTHFQVPAEKIDRVPDCYVFDAKNKMKPYDSGAKTAWAKKPKFVSGGGGLVSTLADYHRFAKMLLNGGAYEGGQIIGRKTLELMTSNHLPGGGDLTEHSKALFSEAENAGTGFGLGFATTIDSAKTMTLGSEGDFFWGGMFSTAFFVDPVEDVIMIFMTQLMPSSTYPVRREIKTMLYSALND